MSITGTTPTLAIPYPESGNKPTGAEFLNLFTIVENYLLAGTYGSGGTRVFAEGTYAYAVNGDGTVNVSVAGTPALRAVVSNIFVEKSGTLTWSNVPTGGTYYLYATTTANTYRDKSDFTLATSGTPPTGPNQLLLATLDNSSPGSPVLDTSPVGKVTGDNFAAHITDSTDPHGSSLTQTALSILDQLSVALGTAKSANFAQADSVSSTPVIAISNAGTGPDIKGGSDLKLADARAVFGIPLTEASYYTLPFVSSLVRGIREAHLPTWNVLTYAATLNTDASTGSHFRCLLTGNFTLANPTNAIDGQRITWRFRQDALGSHTITYDTKFRTGADVAATSLTTSAHATDYVTATYYAPDDRFDIVEVKRGYVGSSQPPAGNP